MSTEHEHSEARTSQTDDGAEADAVEQLSPEQQEAVKGGLRGVKAAIKHPALPGFKLAAN